MKKKKTIKSGFRTTRDFLAWAQERKEGLKNLQDLALDNYHSNKEELSEWLEYTNETMKELDIFIKDCENVLFK